MSTQPIAQSLNGDSPQSHSTNLRGQRKKALTAGEPNVVHQDKDEQGRAGGILKEGRAGEGILSQRHVR